MLAVLTDLISCIGSNRNLLFIPSNHIKGWKFLCWSQISPYISRMKSGINTDNYQTCISCPIQRCLAWCLFCNENNDKRRDLIIIPTPSWCHCSLIAWTHKLFSTCWCWSESKVMAECISSPAYCQILTKSSQLPVIYMPSAKHLCCFHDNVFIN